MLYLASYPRSGNHWVRFILEWFSGQPSYGCRTNPRDRPICENTFPNDERPLLHVNLNASCVCQKVHSVGELRRLGFSSNDKLLLLVRDWRECLLRHVGISQQVYNDWNALNQEYLRHSGPKLLIYYEDLLLDPKETIGKIVRFSGCYTAEKMQEFLAQYDHLAALSRKGTNRDWKPSISGTDVDYHKKQVDAKVFSSIALPLKPNEIEQHYW